MGRIFKLNSPEWPYILMGCIGALVGGCVQPAFAFIFAEVITVMYNTHHKKGANKDFSKETSNVHNTK